MKRNINGFKLNKNGKPITIEQGLIRYNEYKGVTYKLNGEYQFFIRESKGEYIYRT